MAFFWTVKRSPHIFSTAAATTVAAATTATAAATAAVPLGRQRLAGAFAVKTEKPEGKEEGLDIVAAAAAAAAVAAVVVVVVTIVRHAASGANTGMA